MCPMFQFLRELPKGLVSVAPVSEHRPDSLWVDAAENKKTATAPEDLPYNRQTPEGARNYKLLKKETYKNFYLEP